MLSKNTLALLLLALVFWTATASRFQAPERSISKKGHTYSKNNSRSTWLKRDEAYAADLNNQLYLAASSGDVETINCLLDKKIE